jgi:hypothetical protein
VGRRLPHVYTSPITDTIAVYCLFENMNRFQWGMSAAMLSRTRALLRPARFHEDLPLHLPVNPVLIMITASQRLRLPMNLAYQKSPYGLGSMNFESFQTELPSPGPIQRAMAPRKILETALPYSPCRASPFSDLFCHVVKAWPRWMRRKIHVDSPLHSGAAATAVKFSLCLRG